MFFVAQTLHLEKRWRLKIFDFSIAKERQNLSRFSQHLLIFFCHFYYRVFWKIKPRIPRTRKSRSQSVNAWRLNFLSKGSDQHIANKIFSHPCLLGRYDKRPPIVPKDKWISVEKELLRKGVPDAWQIQGIDYFRIFHDFFHDSVRLRCWQKIRVFN